MDIRPILTEADYKATLPEVFDLGGIPTPIWASAEGDRLDILAPLECLAYEAKHLPICAPDPVEAIKFRMDQSGLSVEFLSRSLARATASTKS